MGSQQILPFAEAEASYDDRRNMLAGALKRVDADLHLARLCLWVFDVTKGGQAGLDLTKSYEELAARPFGLCCSCSKARTTANKARQVGLLSVREQIYASFGQRANAYQIDWDGVRSLLDYTRRPGGHRVSPQDTPLSPQDTPLSPQDSPIRKYNLFKDTSLKETPDPDPGAAPGQEVVLEDGAPAAKQAGPAQPPEWPELRDAAQVHVAALPAGTLASDVYSGLSRGDLGHPGKILTWFRRQLGAYSPVVAPSEAALLLVLSAAMRADRMAEAEVRKSRVAVFVGQVAHGSWLRCRRYLPDAAAWLARQKERYPDLLTCDQWPPVARPVECES